MQKKKTLISSFFLHKQQIGFTSISNRFLEINFYPIPNLNQSIKNYKKLTNFFIKRVRGAKASLLSW